MEFGGTLAVRGPGAAQRWVFDLLTEGRYRHAYPTGGNPFLFFFKFASYEGGHAKHIEANYIFYGTFDHYEAGRFLELTAR
jgi:hypothetical protein